MRIGVVVDSSCDLPADFIERHNIKILPATIRIEGDAFADERNPEATLEFFRSQVGDKSHDALTTPFSVKEIEDLFLEKLVLDFDYVFCIIVWSGRSKTFENASKAAYTILSRYHDRRKEADVKGPFSMRVIDSKNLFSAVGVLAAETVQQAENGESHAKIRAKLGTLTERTICYLVPSDLTYIRKRAVQRGEKSVGLASYLIANTLDIRPVLMSYREETRAVSKARGYSAAVQSLFQHITSVVREGGVSSHYVCLSYAGDPAEVRTMTGYDELARTCEQNDLELLLSIMGATGAVNVGTGALSASYIGEYRDFRG